MPGSDMCIRWERPPALCIRHRPAREPCAQSISTALIAGAPWPTQSMCLTATAVWQLAPLARPWARCAAPLADPVSTSSTPPTASSQAPARPSTNGGQRPAWSALQLRRRSAPHAWFLTQPPRSSVMRPPRRPAAPATHGEAGLLIATAAWRCHAARPPA